MFPNISPEEKELFRPVARAEALDFLQTQMDAVDAKINARRAHLARAYPAGTPLPRGEGELLNVYEQEQALIQELMDATQEGLLIEVLQRRREATQRRVSELAQSGAGWSKRWQAQTEWEALSELQRRWLAWLKQERSWKKVETRE